MATFELNRLSSYDDRSLLNELRRVAALVPHAKLHQTDLNEFGKVHSTTLLNRFGNWRKALAAAGLESRFDDRREEWSRDEIIEELQSISKATGKGYVTHRELQARIGITQNPIIRIFGSYRAALEAAGLSQSPGSARYSNEECFENLLTLWTTLGRQPYRSDMTKPPSRIGPKAYIGRWGSWRKTLEAFVERANQETSIEQPSARISETKTSDDASLKRTSRDIPMGLRYKILIRDHCHCLLCGQSPATNIATRIHVDHIIPWSRGGETVLENLRVLCEACNLGKGASLE